MLTNDNQLTNIHAQQHTRTIILGSNQHEVHVFECWELKDIHLDPNMRNYGVSNSQTFHFKALTVLTELPCSKMMLGQTRNG